MCNGEWPWPMFLSACPAPQRKRPSYVERVVLQVAPERLWEWQLVGAVRVSVDGEACQVLQRREGLGSVQGAHELQRHATVLCCALNRAGLCFGVDVVLIRCLALRRVAWAGVVLYQAENIGEGLQVRQAWGEGVQPERAPAVLYSYTGGSTAGLHWQGQHVLRVAAVPHQECAFTFRQEGVSSLTRWDGTPVPACNKMVLISVFKCILFWSHLILGWFLGSLQFLPHYHPQSLIVQYHLP